MPPELSQFQEKFKKWKRLPEIRGKYDRFQEIPELGYSAHMDNFPAFDASVKKALKVDKISVEDIAEVVIQTYQNVTNTMDYHVFFRNEKNQFLHLGATETTVFEGLRSHDYKGRLPQELYDKTRPVITYLEDIEAAYRFACSVVVEEVGDLPRQYFL